MILYLDTSQRDTKLVKIDDHQIETSGDVLVAVKKLFGQLGIGWWEIERVEINRGPGSFTGLRVGAAIANAANWALGKVGVGDIVLPRYGRAPNISKPKKV